MRAHLQFRALGPRTAPRTAPPQTQPRPHRARLSHTAREEKKKGAEPHGELRHRLLKLSEIDDELSLKEMPQGRKMILSFT